MVATISADIVKSTSLSTEELLFLRNRIRGLLDDLAFDLPGFWGRIVRGDSIECYVKDSRDVLRIAVLIKLFIKMTAGQLNCSELMRRYGIRFSIGIGNIDYVSKEEDIIKGEAIYISGRNLDEITRRKDLSSFEIGPAPQSTNRIMDSYVAMIGNLVDSYSTKQSAVVFYKLMGLKEIEIGNQLGISQSSVNIRSSNAQWGLLSTAIKDFENLNFEEICG